MPDVHGEDPRPAADRPDRATVAGSAVRAATALVLALLLVVGLVSTGYLAYRKANPTADPFDPSAGPVLPSARERAEVTTVAEQFTLRMDNVDGSKFDEYVEGVDALLTTKAKKENKGTLEALEDAYRTAEVKGTGKVLVTGVSDLTSDKATVLVAHDADVSTKQGDIEHHYRWAIDLVKVDGDWLVDGFTPVS